MLGEDPSDFFYMNKCLLIVSGIWIPPKKEGDERRWKIVAAYCTLILIFVQLAVVAEIVMVKDTIHDVDMFFEHLPMIILNTLASIKVLFVFMNKKKILEILDLLNSKKLNSYVAVDDFYPAAIMKKHRRLVNSTTITFYCLVMGTIYYSFVAATIRFFSTSAESFYAGNVTCLDILPYYTWVPFGLYEKKNTCGLTIPIQFMQAFYAGHHIIATDTFITSIEGKLEAHLILVQEAFKTILSKSAANIKSSNETDERNRKVMLEREMKLYMNEYTQHLQMIITVINKLESIISYIHLGCTLMYLCVLAPSLVIVLTVPFTDMRFWTQFGYTLYMVYQLWMYTSFANRIIIATSDVSQALYFCEWFAATGPFKSDMLINMIRFQKPMYFTIAKFYPISLNTFVSILRASYSLCAVLRQVNARNTAM